MNCLENMKKNNWWIFIILCFGITPYIFHLADLERGYNATGGEIFVPIILIIMLQIKKLFDERNEENE